MSIHRKAKTDAKRTTDFATRTHEVLESNASGYRDLAAGEHGKTWLGNDPFLPMLSPFWAWRMTNKL